MRRIEGNELAESRSCVFSQSDLQDGGRQRSKQGFLQLGPMSWKTGLFPKSVWITEARKDDRLKKQQQQSTFTAGKSREY